MTKAEIREKVWTTIEREGVARFPWARGRIPNFDGADRAAQLLRELAVWRRALVVKVNPDAPQLAVRRLALAEGKILYMAVPRLRAEKCFIELDPQRFPKGVLPSASIAAARRPPPPPAASERSVEERDDLRQRPHDPSRHRPAFDDALPVGVDPDRVHAGTRGGADVFHRVVADHDRVVRGRGELAERDPDEGGMRL